MCKCCDEPTHISEDGSIRREWYRPFPPFYLFHRVDSGDKRDNWYICVFDNPKKISTCRCPMCGKKLGRFGIVRWVNSIFYRLIFSALYT